ncbi:MAG: exosome complex protein Rrp42 [Candidatus Woesearchaeota archaeon]
MNQEKNHLLQFYEKGLRIDGRKLSDYRQPVKIEYGVSETAEGSATVTIGNTIVMAGVKMEIGKPFPDTPEDGGLMVNVELLPLSNPEFEVGPPGIDAIELARVVDRGIRESKAIDTKKLCIEKGEKIWTIMIDVISINAEGNLLDACGLAALAALRDARFPKYDGEKLDFKTKTDEKVSITKVPVPITIHKIGNYLIVDPLPEEEKLSEARLTITTTEDGELCSLQKGGDTPLTVEEIDQMVEIAKEKGNFLRKFLE